MPKTINARREVREIMKDQKNQHFSHHHALDSLTPQQGVEISCDACEQDITEPFHGCIKCNYHLHDKCFNTPRSLNHPSHPSHPLTLHQTPTYSSGSYICNACDSEGNRFSLSCAECEFDIHLQCANLPDSILIDQHPHELKLIFDSPYTDPNTVITCDVCLGTMNPDRWSYYCAGCDFGSHLDCVNGPKEIPEDEDDDDEDINRIHRSAQALANAQLRALVIAQSGRAMRNFIRNF